VTKKEVGMVNIGSGEVFVIFIVTVLSLAFPLGILFFLYKIYAKLKDIEEQLRKK
jgi:hypothetical protein